MSLDPDKYVIKLQKKVKRNYLHKLYIMLAACQTVTTTVTIRLHSSPYFTASMYSQRDTNFYNLPLGYYICMSKNILFNKSQLGNFTVNWLDFVRV